MRTLRICLRATAVTLVLTGLVYPLAMTGAARVLFRDAAAGSLVTDGKGRVVGSALVGQPFKNPAYFQGRPSAAGNGYDATASGGSNLGPSSAKLRDRVAADVDRLRKENPDAPLPIPADLVTASASGLDPHVTPAGAAWQIPRVARARGVDPERIRRLVDHLTEGRQLGWLGEPRVNILSLNLALDRQLGAPPAPPTPTPPTASQ
jgi:K+-transporting ATPase ATPase C chain